MERNKTKQVRIGGVALGGGAPVRVQSMTTTPTSDVARTLEQIGRLYAAGCEIVRVAVRGRGGRARDPRAARPFARADRRGYPFFGRPCGALGGERGG